MSKKTTVDNETLEKDTLSAEENREVEQAASVITDAFSGVWKYTLKEPLEYMDETYTELEFDFGKLTGADIAAIEREMEQVGLNPFSNAGFSDSYAERAAVLACTTLNDTYAIEELWGADYNAVIRRTRTFLSIVKMAEIIPRRAWKFELSKPLEVGNKKYTELVFDYKKIKGKQLVEIVSDLENKGLSTYAKTTASYDYSARLALAACSAELKITDLEKLGAAEFCEIITRAKLFLAGIAV